VGYARVLLELTGRPLFKSLFRAYVAVDGDVQETAWGQHEYVVTAGDHLFEVWMRAWFGRDIRRAVLSIDVAADTQIRLRYRHHRRRSTQLYQVGDATAAQVAPSSLPKAVALDRSDR
jgi:hypothetical protein